MARGTVLKWNFSNYRLGLQFFPVKTKKHQFFLKAAGPTGKRVPLFLELFGESGTIIGNSDLKPETAETVEAGTGYQRKDKFRGKKYGGAVSFTVFRRQIKDMILFVPNSQFTLRPENIDAANIKGAEFSIKLNFLEHFKLYANYTYQKAVNRSSVVYLNGKYLPLRPLHEIHEGLAYYNNYIEVGGEAHHVGAVFKDRSNEYTNYEEARWLFNIYFKWSVYGRKNKEKELLVGLEIKNLNDSQVSDVIGYPLPGRSIYATLSYRF